MSYQEAIDSGIAPNKTSSIQLKNGQIYKLDYVRDSDEKFSTYGRVELPLEKFKEIVSIINKDYSLKDVAKITLFGKNDDIAKGELLKHENINGYAVAYLDKNNNAMLDHYNFATGKKESHLVSAYYATVINYFSKLPSNVKNPCTIDIVLKGFDSNKIIFISKTNDTLYRKISKIS